MKKRIMALVCLIVLVASMSLTVFAKPSPQGGRIEAYDANDVLLGILKIEEDAVTGSIECDHGDECDGCIEVITPVLSENRDIVDSLNIEDLIKGTEYADQEWIKIFEMDVIAKGCVEFPTTLKFDKDDWVEGKPIIAHYNQASQKWELAELDEETGKFYAEFNSLSTFVFFIEKGAAGTTSPTTGEPISMAAAAAVIGAAGLAVVSKKKRS